MCPSATRGVSAQLVLSRPSFHTDPNHPAPPHTAAHHPAHPSGPVAAHGRRVLPPVRMMYVPRTTPAPPPNAHAERHGRARNHAHTTQGQPRPPTAPRTTQPAHTRHRHSEHCTHLHTGPLLHTQPHAVRTSERAAQAVQAARARQPHAPSHCCSAAPTPLPALRTAATPAVLGMSEARTSQPIGCSHTTAPLAASSTVTLPALSLHTTLESSDEKPALSTCAAESRVQ